MFQDIIVLSITDVLDPMLTLAASVVVFQDARQRTSCLAQTQHKKTSISETRASKRILPTVRMHFSSRGTGQTTLEYNDHTLVRST